ncbi:MAG: hypothetical protein AB7V13_18365 [Pseudorhodoplanes sp.]
MITLVRNVGLVLFALCIVAPSAHGASQTVPIGGTGGGPFRILCPDRQVLVGFSMRLGSAMDAIGPICARMRKSGKTLRPTTVPAFTGGGGGAGQVVACPFNSFVHNLNVFVDRCEIVNHVEIRCRNLKNSAPFAKWRSTPHGGTPARNYEVHCQVNQIPNGIHGKSGGLVDSLGMLCDLPSLIVR